MNLDLMYSGHLHELIYVSTDIEADTTLTHTPAYSGKEENKKEYTVCKTSFPTILVSKRGTSQILADSENYFDKVFIGVAASFDGNETTLKFTNEKSASILLALFILLMKILINLSLYSVNHPIAYLESKSVMKTVLLEANGIRTSLTMVQQM